MTPTTAQINVLQYGETIERQVRESNLHVITAPAPLLREIHIVDTPGTNAIIREHEAHHRASSCRGPTWCCS